MYLSKVGNIVVNVETIFYIYRNDCTMKLIFLSVQFMK